VDRFETLLESVFVKRSETLNGLEYIKAGDTYPYPWLNDSVCIAGWGMSCTDPLRAMNQIRFVLRYALWNSEEAQRLNQEGFPGHIVFTKPGARYFPSESIWQADAMSRELPTSGITQFPFLASAVLSIWQEAVAAGLSEQAAAFLDEVYPSVKKSCEVLVRVRDPHDEGILSIFCPWEDMDNSPRHDSVLYGFDRKLSTDRYPWIVEQVPTRRQDIRDPDGAVNPHKVLQRPTHEFYVRVWTLIERMKELGYDQRAIYDEGYFNIKNVSFTAVFARSSRDLAELARLQAQRHPSQAAPYLADSATWDARFEKIRQGLNHFAWDSKHGMYHDINVTDPEHRRALPLSQALAQGNRIGRNTVGSFFTLWAGVPQGEKLERLAANLENPLTFGARFDGRGLFVPSLSMDDPDFDPENYWRGPAWVVTNWLLACGLLEAGKTDLADELFLACLVSLADGQVAEHVNPCTGLPGGNMDFPWSGAHMLWILRKRPHLRSRLPL